MAEVTLPRRNALRRWIDEHIQSKKEVSQALHLGEGRAWAVWSKAEPRYYIVFKKDSGYWACECKGFHYESGDGECWHIKECKKRQKGR